MTQGESRLSRDIMTALRNRGVWCMKIHGGPTMLAGAPDIVACVPVQCCESPVSVGIFVGFETKMPEGKDPTPKQRHEHNKIRAAYGEVFVPRSVEDAVDALRSVGWVGVPPPRPNASETT